LHEEKITEDSHIYVDTVAGVVTLTGSVLSSDTAAHAGRLARQTEGVMGANNELKVSQAANMD
jgi:osmotically-inducible protein OsmY